jgi:hypothetical protein
MARTDYAVDPIKKLSIEEFSMFGSLVRWFGFGVESQPSRCRAALAPRFTPQLEGLEARATPCHVGGWLGEEIPSGGPPGYEVAATGGAGAAHGNWSHQVDLKGGTAGGIVIVSGGAADGVVGS